MAVFASPSDSWQQNRFFCSTCGQYNGFRADGDYNVERPELFVEELNPRPVARGVFRLHAQDMILCAKCLSKQEHWLLHGREAEQSAPLCPDCAFAVREAVTRNALHARKCYLTTAIASTRGASNIRAEKQSVGIVARVALVTVLLLSLCLLSLSSLSSRVGALWFFAAEVNVATELFALLTADWVLSLAGGPWHGWWIVGSAVLLLIPLFVRIPRALVVGAVAAAWGLALGAVVAHTRHWARVRNARELQRQKLKQMDEPPPAATREREGEEEQEEEDPWQLGVPGRGWSSRKPAFEFKPGEYEPGAMVLGAPAPKPPTSDELAVESLLSSISIVSSGDDESDGAGAKAKLRVLEVWRRVPRMTLGSIAVALSCRIVFLERDWSTRVYAVFLALASGAILVETGHRFKRYLSGVLAALAVAALLPWQAIWGVVWSQVELLVIVGVAAALFLLRNKS